MQSRNTPSAILRRTGSVTAPNKNLAAKVGIRVLRPHGALMFKWNETQIPTREILALTDEKPTVVQRVCKNDKTHWMTFYKGAGDEKV